MRVQRSATLSPRVSAAALSINGFRSASYDGDHLRMRVSGDAVTASNARFFGPFRIGFLYSLIGCNVMLETFPRSDAAGEAAALVLPVGHLSALAALPPGNVDIADVEVGPVKVIEHRHGREAVVLEAARCHATVSTARVICTDGVIDRAGTGVPFRRLSHDGKTLQTVQ